jgi:hypothetical protein
MSRRKSAIGVVIVSLSVVIVAACSSSTSPKDLTNRYVGTYSMDSVQASALDSTFPPNGTVDSAVGVTGLLVLKPDSFYITLVGSFPEADSGTFSISGDNKWTLSGNLFSGTGTGALIGSQLQLQLTGGAALGNLNGWFTKQN